MYRKLGRKSSHRISMLNNLGKSLIVNKKIVTTISRAKELIKIMDRFITKAKKGDLNSIRLISKDLKQHGVVLELVKNIAPKYVDRNGGYLTLKKVGRRVGDNTQMALLSFVNQGEENVRI